MNQTFEVSSSPATCRQPSDKSTMLNPEGIRIHVDSPESLATPTPRRRRLSIAEAFSPITSPLVRRKSTPYPNGSKSTRSSPFLKVFKRMGKKKVKFQQSVSHSDMVDETAFQSALSALETSDISDISDIAGEDLSSDDEDEKMMSKIEDLLEDRRLEEARKEIFELNVDLMDKESYINDLVEEIENLKQMSTTRESARAEEKRKLTTDVVLLTAQVATLTTESTQLKIQIEDEVSSLVSQVRAKDDELRELKLKFEEQVETTCLLENQLREKDEQLSTFQMKMRKKMRTSSLSNLSIREDAVIEHDDHGRTLRESTTSINFPHLKRAKLPQVEKRPVTKPVPFSFVIREEEKRAAKKEEEKRAATKKPLPR